MRSIKEAFEAFTARRIIAIAMIFASLVAPTFIAMYRFDRSAFEHWESWRLLLFCAALSLPSVIAGVFTGGALDESAKISGLQDFLSFGVYLSALTQNAAHLFVGAPGIRNWFPPTLRGYMYALGAAHVALVICVLLYNLVEGRKRIRLAAKATAAVEASPQAIAHTKESPDAETVRTSA